MRRTVLRWVLAILMILIGVGHFIAPAPFAQIVPDYLPAPVLLVLVSGFFEVLGGAGLLIPKVRRASGIGLVLLYLAVFPANIYSAMNHIPAEVPPVLLWVRLPFQLLFIAWALYASREATPIENKI